MKKYSVVFFKAFSKKKMIFRGAYIFALTAKKSRSENNFCVIEVALIQSFNMNVKKKNKKVKLKNFVLAY